MKIPRKSAWLGFVLGGLFGYALHAISLPIMCPSKGVRVAADILELDARLDRYKRFNGAYPTTEQGLQPLGTTPQDPWGSNYYYRCPGKRYPSGYDLFSMGPDRYADSADDGWGK